MKDNWKQPEKNVFLFERKVKVLVTQLCPTLCDPMDCSSPGSSVHGILQARILESVAISFSRGSSQSRDWNWVSCIAGRFYRWSHQRRPFLFFLFKLINLPFNSSCIWTVHFKNLFYFSSFFYFIYGVVFLDSVYETGKERERRKVNDIIKNYIKLLFLIYKYRVRVY